MPRSSFRTRAALWTATGLIGASLAAGGIAQAVSSPSPSPGDKTAGPAAKAKAGHGKHHGLGARILHGDVVVRAKDGYRKVALQRGTVVSASATSLQVRSADGFTATYVLNGDTRLRKGHRSDQPVKLATGDLVTVVATRSGDSLTATRVVAHPVKAKKDAAERS